MITVRHIERLFSHQQHPRLYRELIAGRPEATLGGGVEAVLARVVPIAALGMIRLDELSQSHTSMYRRLLNVVLTAQRPDGGWGDAMTTATAVRALLGGGTSHSAAAERGLAYLARLQTEDGLFRPAPATTARDALATPLDACARAREVFATAGDAFVTAFTLMQLGDRSAFRDRVRSAQAVRWFGANQRHLDEPTRRLWNHASVRCRMTPAEHGSHETLWHSTRPAA